MNSVVFLHIFCLILLYLGIFCLISLLLIYFAFHFCGGFGSFLKVYLLLFYFVFVCCFKGREKRNIRLDRKVGRIWEELGKGKIMIRICCMENCSHKKLNKFQKYLVQT